MTDRDNFTPATKRALAARVANKCCFPYCDAITSGPSDESNTAVSNVGHACHITAAANGPGARRYDPNMSPEQRSSIDNGIWMCGKHAIEIDRDEKRFTVDKLKHWKEIAEEKARLTLDYGASFADKLPQLYIKELAPSNTSIKLDNLSGANALVGNAIRDSYIPLLWGENETAITRDLIIEICRNSFAHGSAQEFSIKISVNIIEVTYDGPEFNIFSMLEREGCGGKETLEELISLHSNSIAISYHYESRNKILIHRVADFEELEPTLPCAINFNYENIVNSVATLNVHETCGAIYIVLPEDFVRSDVRGMESKLSDIQIDGKIVFIVGKKLAQSTIDAISRQFPNFKLTHKSANT